VALLTVFQVRKNFEKVLKSLFRHTATEMYNKETQKRSTDDAKMGWPNKKASHF